MRRYWIYACIIILILRVFLVPLFFPFGTYGFIAHAILALLLIIISISWMTGVGRERGVNIILICVGALDFAFFILAKLSTYGDFQYYPRYTLLTIPLLFSVLVVNTVGKQKK